MPQIIPVFQQLIQHLFGGNRDGFQLDVQADLICKAQQIKFLADLRNVEAVEKAVHLAQRHPASQQLVGQKAQRFDLVRFGSRKRFFLGHMLVQSVKRGFLVDAG